MSTAGQELRLLLELRRLPWPVARFHWRAHRLAAATGDEFSLASATRPAKLAELLVLARGRRRVVELGTATAWTASALVLSDPGRTVRSYDPFDRPERERYLALLPPRARARLNLHVAPGHAGPTDAEPVDLLYIDSSHEREETLRELAAWRPVLRTGAVVVFDDYTHDGYPGVREAVAELGLAGYERAGLFVHPVQR